MIVNIVTLIVLLLEIFFITIIIIKSCRNKVIISKQNAIWFLPIFVFLYVLYLLCYLESTDEYSVVIIINHIVYTLKTFAFEINTNFLNALFNKNILFTVTFSIAYLMAIFTTISTAFGFVKNYIRNKYRINRLRTKGCDIVIGYNEAAHIYLNKHKDKTIVWLNNDVNPNLIKDLNNSKIAYIISEINESNLIGFLKKKVRYNFIAFNYEQEQYQNLINTFINIQSKDYYIFLYLEVKFNEAEVVRNEYLKRKDSDESNLFIRTFSRYELISRKFVSEVTIPYYLPQDFYNENRTIKEYYKINVFFLGFGKVNTSLFTMFCQNNQLVGMDEGTLVNHLVNYYVIDRDPNAVNAKRIKYIIDNVNKMESDFIRPEPLCNFEIINWDVNSSEGINKVKRIVNQKNSFNFIIVSYGNDFENAETAIWLQNELNSNNCVIACRLRNIEINNDKILCFGNEEEIISHEYIVDDELLSFAKEIDAIYSKLNINDYLEYERHWDTLNQIELYSNLYSAISLKFKLNLMGLGVSKDPNQKSLSFEEVMAIYSKDSNPNPTYEDYFKTTIRNVIAYSEKLRWNAFYIFNGYKPMLKKDVEEKIKENKGTVIRKDHQAKKHICLTSMRGLEQVHQYLYQTFGKQLNVTIEDIETYKYDYMAFDKNDINLIKTLLDRGYKIYYL